MKIAIVECVMKSNSKDAHVRQAEFIRDDFIKLGHTCEILYINTLGKNVNNKYDVIIKSYSTFYENYKAELELYKNNKDNARFFFITNEYTIQASNVLNKSAKEGCKWNIIANFNKDKITGKIWYKKFSVNLNCLFYNKKTVKQKKYNVCYYGTYRKNRRKYFQKYFTSKDFILSTSPKSIKKFIKDDCKFTPCKRFDWNKLSDTLGLFSFTLYIEDEWIHQNFHNLADRFYEALSNETVILFDKSCIHTLQNSELKNENYKDFLIDSYEEITKRNYNTDLQEQKKWIKIIEAEKQKTFKQLEEIIIGC